MIGMEIVSIMLATAIADPIAVADRPTAVVRNALKYVDDKFVMIVVKKLPRPYR